MLLKSLTLTWLLLFENCFSLIVEFDVIISLYNGFACCFERRGWRERLISWRPRKRRLKAKCLSTHLKAAVALDDRIKNGRVFRTD